MNTAKYKHKNMQSKIQNINYKAYKEISKFKYLSKLVTGEHDFGKDVRARITAGSWSHQARSKLWNKDKYKKHNTDTKILQGCEMWAPAGQWNYYLKRGSEKY